MDWIHCNKCFIQPGDVKDKRYFLTSCGHIYCDSCIKQGASEKCGVCESKFNTIPLTSQMKPEVQEFFSDMDEMVSKVAKVLQFQIGHRTRLVQNQKTVALKYKAAKEEIKRYHEIIRGLQKKNKDLEKEVQSMKQQGSPHQSSAGRNSQISPSGTKFFMSPITPPHSQSMGKTMPSFSKAFPRISPNPSQLNASVNSWVTNNRITLPRHSPASKGSSPASQPASSPDLNVGTYVYNSPKRGNNFTVSYRSGNQYSSQPTTPKTPSTPGTFSSPGTPDEPRGLSPGMPLSSITGQSQHVRPGRSIISSSPIPMNILSLKSQQYRANAV